MYNKKKKKCGFTLMELLAVITILAVIALIILPIVTNVIEKTRRNSFINSIYSGMRAINDDLSNNDFAKFPSNGILAKTGIPTLEKNPFIDGKFRLNGKEVEAFKVTDGRYCATGTKKNLETILGPCYLLDKTAPEANLVAGTITSNSIQVIMNTYDEESEIVSYEFSIDNGQTWTAKQKENNYTFTKLKNGTSFNIKARVINENKLTTEKSITLKTLDIAVPTYTSNPSLTAWSKNKVITIHYPTRQNNFIYEYSLDNGRTWQVVSTGTTYNVTFNNNGNITARVRDGYNTVTASTLTITTVDTLSPTVSLDSTGVTNFSISVKATATGSHMGIKGYQYSKDNGATWTAVTTANTYTYTGLSRNTTYPLMVKVIAGNDKTATSAVKNVKTLNNFNVTFNANGGSVSPTSKTVTGGSTYGTLPTPSRTNYVFLGWYTAASGGSKITSTSTVSLSSDITLYAQWKLNTVVVTFNANGGSVSPTSKSVTVGSAVGSLPTPSRSSYTFKGWFDARGGGTQMGTGTVINSARTFYARWYHNTSSVSKTNSMKFTLTLKMTQTGLNSVTISPVMTNANRSACGNGSVSYSCTGGKSGSSAYTYKFGVSGTCDYVYNGSWSVNLPGYTVTGLPGGSSVTCTYTFDPKSNSYFGSALSASVTFTMGN